MQQTNASIPDVYFREMNFLSMKYCLSALICLLCLPSPGRATVHVVQVSSSGYSPASLSITLGDSIQWVWLSGAHSTTSISIPTGAAPWDAPISSTNTSFLLSPQVPGFYQYASVPAPALTGSFMVSCSAQPQMPQISGANAFCSGSSTPLSVTAAGFLLQWYRDNMPIPGAVQDTFFASLPGDCKVRLANSCGIFWTDTLQLAMWPEPQMEVTPHGAEICAGSCDTFVATGAESYLWYIPNSSLQSFLGPVQVFCPPSHTSIHIWGTDAHGCVDEDTMVLLVKPSPHSSFSYSGQDQSYQFTNHTTGAQGFEWDFGDGTHSTATNPQHQYAAPGAYIVRLAAFGPNGCMTEQVQTVFAPASIPVSGSLQAAVYPNPVSDRLYVQVQGRVEARLLDLQGRVVFSGSGRDQLLLDTHALPQGVYFLRLLQNGLHSTHRILVHHQ